MMEFVTASETAVFMSVISDTVGSRGIIKAEAAILAKASLTGSEEKVTVMLFLFFIFMYLLIDAEHGVLDGFIGMDYPVYARYGKYPVGLL